MPDPRDTPAMRQYYRFKRQHPDCTLLFRIGDFYEMFDDDAVKVSKAIGLTLTQRTEGVPMAGMPFHQLETYLRKLLNAGFRVAVCEQTETPADAKERGGASAVIERAVTRVLTPGTLVDESLLDGDAPSTLAAVCFTGEGDHSPAVAAVVDLSTGRFEVFESPGETLGDELSRRRVSELVYAQTADGKEPPRVKAVLAVLGIGGAGTPQPSWYFRMDEAREALLKQYGVATLEGFGLAPDDPAIRAAGAVVRYLQTTQLPSSDHSTSDTPHPASRSLAHLEPPRRDEPTRFCILDGTTLRSLEVLRTIRAAPSAGEDSDGSLLGTFASSRTFPGCRTAMGKRLLREWLCRPLRDIAAIEARQKCVATLIEDRQTAAALSAAMEFVQDIARIAGRLALGRANPRDVVALGRSLSQVTPVGESLANAPAFASHKARIDALSAKLRPLAERIADRCVESPPPHLREGGLFKDGFDAELDEARRLGRDAAGWMAEYQARLIAEHQLPSLKVGYNKIFGYYIELPSAQSKRAPDAFTRKQTLKNAERYITPELKDFESRASTAEARALAREQSLFEDLCDRARGLIPEITAFADAIAELDVFACFAEKAARRRWVKPEIVDQPVLGLEQARHPVLDERLERNFVPNDLWLGVGASGALAGYGSDDVTRRRSDEEKAAPTPSDTSSLRHSVTPSLALITGPNMAGKSTFIRTAALLTLLAHTGSFVPADKAVVGITDRIFTRIGADDALHAGQSTFMVEMTETARILNHATERSLVVLDEIGRGTSTLDGLSLAWAIAETLAGERGRVAKWQGGKVEQPSDSAHSATPPLRHSATSSAPRTLFATHYHELTDLEEMLPGRVVNLHVSVREWGEEIVFLHRILPGRTDRSYGVHVAKLAGLPSATVARAKEILETLAVQHHGPTGGGGGAGGGKHTAQSTKHAPIPAPSAGQLALFTEFLAHPAVDELREVKLDALTPLQAFDVLRKLKGMTDAAK